MFKQVPKTSQRVNAYLLDQKRTFWHLKSRVLVDLRPLGRTEGNFCPNSMSKLGRAAECVQKFINWRLATFTCFDSVKKVLAMLFGYRPGISEHCLCFLWWSHGLSNQLIEENSSGLLGPVHVELFSGPLWCTTLHLHFVRNNVTCSSCIFVRTFKVPKLIKHMDETLYNICRNQLFCGPSVPAPEACSWFCCWAPIHQVWKTVWKSQPKSRARLTPYDFLAYSFT